MNERIIDDFQLRFRNAIIMTDGNSGTDWGSVEDGYVYLMYHIQIWMNFCMMYLI